MKVARQAGVLVLILTFAAGIARAVEVERFERQVILKTQFAVVLDNVKLKEGGRDATWQWCTLAEHLPHLAYVSIAFSEDRDAPSWQTRRPKPVAGSPEGITCIELPAAHRDSKSKNIDATVSAVFTKLQVPFPKAIRQEDPQNVLYSGNLYVLSPHCIGTQTIKYETSSNDIISYTMGDKVERRQRSVTYGPYKGVAPFAQAPLRLHYKNNAPFAVASTLERTLDVAWGKIHVEERYTLTHGGAKLTGPWSRYDYSTAPQTFAQAAFRELAAEAPSPARHLYFRDVIGNVSTSAVRHTLNGISAALLPRTPLYGGWSTDFVFGFELPLRMFSARNPKDGRKELVYSFGPHVQGLVVDDFTLKVILPEGATDITAEANFEVDIHMEPKYTYLKKAGRTVVLLRASNIVDAHNQPFVVRYRVPPFAWLREPALWGSSLAALLAACVLFVRFDFSLVQKGAKSAARYRDQATAVVQRASSVFAERRRALTALEAAFVKPGAKDADVLLVSRNTEAVLISSNEKLQDAVRKVEALAGPAKAAQLRALVAREAAAAESATNLFQHRLKLLRAGAGVQELKLAAEQGEVTTTRKTVAAAVDNLASSI